MALQPLVQSTEKKVVMQRLGLNEQYYKMLLQEANEVRDRMSQIPANLAPNREGARRPYQWNDLSETAKHREIIALSRTNNPYTRPYYDLGWHYNTVAEENWVARWFLWRSFRYRDNRGGGGTPASPGALEGRALEQDSDGEQGTIVVTGTHVVNEPSK
ncbi:hypothetical protein CC78DRAFT_568140 [Lojkania enalia]|uniref:Uncharacterized protein n=1 Tax=Lojkania enalia TaxID=147567 RepID=A0A9P4KEJ6_9PLEO|nr:hypothetical protein CC78DRAFT_568140 [Didymosphaeria enalia]